MLIKREWLAEGRGPHTNVSDPALADDAVRQGKKFIFTLFSLEKAAETHSQYPNASSHH